MIKEQYQAFKSWLIENNKLQILSNFQKDRLIKQGIFPTEPDYIGLLFSINRFIDRYVATNHDLFILINNERYDLIYNFRFHYRNKRTLTQECLLSFCFEYLGKDFESYKEYEATIYLSKRSKSHTLYIHQGNIACLKYKHPLEDVVASIVTDGNDKIFVHASHCSKCNITFIRKEEYLRLRSRHPFLVANFQEISQDGYTFSKAGKLNGESPLMFCGYNVKANGLCEEHRHALLENIIYNGILSKTDIIQYLEHFINFNGSQEQMFSAVKKWENDLAFIRKFDMEKHPIVSITEIKPYSEMGK